MNPSFFTEHAFIGTRFVETSLATEAVEDWSPCRSPSRARRRERRGYPQRVKRYRKPACYMINGVLHIHPELRDAMERRLANNVDKAMYRALTPTPQTDGGADHG